MTSGLLESLPFDSCKTLSYQVAANMLLDHEDRAVMSEYSVHFSRELISGFDFVSQRIAL